MIKKPLGISNFRYYFKDQTYNIILKEDLEILKSELAGSIHPKSFSFTVFLSKENFEIYWVEFKLVLLEFVVGFKHKFSQNKNVLPFVNTITIILFAWS